MNRFRRGTRRILIGFVGWTVVLIGVVLIPFPGPGWVVVFIGLSVLASEFDWAKEAHMSILARYRAWRTWYSMQPAYIQLIFGALALATAAIIVWLVNGYGFLNSLLDLHQQWLISPFFK